MMRRNLRLCIDGLCRTVSSSPAGNVIGRAARRYTLIHNGVDYDFKTNGERSLVRCILERGLPDPIVFDVGANRGEWTAMALAFAGSAVRVHAFEMNPLMYEDLSIRFAGHSSVVLNCVALCDRPGLLPMRIYRQGPGGGSLVTSYQALENSEIQMTACITGDSYIDECSIAKVDLLKLDVEGAEGLVLQGFGGSLEKQLVSVVQFEYGYANGAAGFLLRDLWNIFENAGYVVGKLRRDGVRFQNFDNAMDNFESGPNFVAALPEYESLIRSFSE